LKRMGRCAVPVDQSSETVQSFSHWMLVVAQLFYETTVFKVYDDKFFSNAIGYRGYREGG